MISNTISTPLVGAIVVLYFPDPPVLERLLESLKGEVTRIFAIDNTPKDELEWLNQDWFTSRGHDVVYETLEDNYGIGQAQNVGIELAIKNNCDHVVLFDQDSAIPAGMIKELLMAEKSLLSRSIEVGAVGPLFMDEKTGEYAKAIRHKNLFVNRISVSPNDIEEVNVDYMIASGSLIRVEALKKIGLMRADLFIDWVDIEWGLRAKKLGYLNFIVPRAVMCHKIGDDFVSVGGRNVNLHNDMRNFYIVRNACYLLAYSDVDIKWRLNMALKVPFYLFFYSIISKNKFKSFCKLLEACLDGFAKRLGKKNGL